MTNDPKKLERITLKNNEKIGLISNLSTMLTAGIPIMEAVVSLLEDAKGNQKKILETLRDDLAQGKSVSMSFARFPKVFNKVTVNILKAAEEAGTLDVVLKDIKENIQKEVEFNDKVRSAMIYPLLIFTVFVGVLLVILTFVVPRISKVFERLNVDLPLPTKIMIWLSNVMLSYTIPFIIVIVLVLVGLFFLYKTKKRLLMNFLFSLPLIKKLAEQIDLTRFSRSLYLLLNSGLPITSALELSEDVVAKKDMAKAITHAKETVLSGRKLSEGFKDNRKIFPSMMIKITEAGEKTGSLDKSMQDISEYMDYEVSKTLASVTTLLEPVMLIFVGIMVGGMMLSIIAPIYGLVGQVGSAGAPR